MDVSPMVTVVIPLALAALLFLVGRSVMLWYWKVNAIEALLQAQLTELKQIRELQMRQVATATVGLTAGRPQ